MICQITETYYKRHLRKVILLSEKIRNLKGPNRANEDVWGHHSRDSGHPKMFMLVEDVALARIHSTAISPGSAIVMKVFDGLINSIVANSPLVMMVLRLNRRKKNS